MTRRPNPAPAGLFTWTPGDPADVQPTEATTNPRNHPCPHCHAQPGEPCTRPGPRGSRVNRRDYHHARGAGAQP